MRALYEEHGAYLRRLVAHLLGPGADPDDVLQEVFIIAWHKLDGVGLAHARSWLSQVAVRRVALSRRRAWVRRFIGMDAAGTLSHSRTPEREVQATEARRVLYALLDKMSEKRRTVLILFEIQGLSGEEIAEILGCPVQTVRTRLFHARRELTALIEADPESRIFDEWR